MSRKHESQSHDRHAYITPQVRRVLDRRSKDKVVVPRSCALLHPETLAVAMNENEVFRMWTVYDHPSDYPGSFVARLFEIDSFGGTRPTASIIVAMDLDTLRNTLAFEMHLTCLTRSPEDDPKIVETWM